MKRNKSLDILRIIAIIMVFYNHKDAYTWYMKYSDSYNLLFAVHSFLAILCKSGAPLFLMISGALLLGKNEDIVTIWKKRLSRMLIVLIWIATSMVLFKMSSGWLQTVFIYSNWYIYSYIGFLFMLPFLRIIAQGLNKNTGRYYFMLVTFFYSISAFFIPRGILSSFLSYIPIITNPGWPSYCWNIIFPICGYLIYYYVNKEVIGKKGMNSKNNRNLEGRGMILSQREITALIVVGGVFAVFLTSLNMYYDIQKNNGVNVESIVQYSTFIPTCAIFYCAINCSSYKDEKEKNWIQVLSRNTFGLYIIEISTPFSPIYINGFVLRNKYLYGTYWYCIVAIIIQFVLYNVLVSALRIIKPINKII